MRRIRMYQILEESVMIPDDTQKLTLLDMVFARHSDATAWINTLGAKDLTYVIQSFYIHK